MDCSSCQGATCDRALEPFVQLFVNSQQTRWCKNAKVCSLCACNQTGETTATRGTDRRQLVTNNRCKNIMFKSNALQTFSHRLTWTCFLFCISIVLDSRYTHSRTHTHIHNWLHREQSQLAPLVAMATKETDFSGSTYSHPVCYSLVCSFIPPFSLPFIQRSPPRSLDAFQPNSIPTSPPMRCPLGMHMQMGADLTPIKKN